MELLDSSSGPSFIWFKRWAELGNGLRVGLGGRGLGVGWSQIVEPLGSVGNGKRGGARKRIDSLFSMPFIRSRIQSESF